MIKNIIVTIGFLLAIIANPAFAHNDKQAKECSKESESFSNAKSKSEFLESCLKKIDMGKFQKEQKAEQCDQNAKNMKSEGDKKDAYLRHCYLEDDAHPNPDQTPHPKM